MRRQRRDKWLPKFQRGQRYRELKTWREGEREGEREEKEEEEKE